MSTTNIKLKRSSVPGKQPNTSILELGEVALNTYDGKLFIKKDDGAESIVTIQEVTEDNLVIDSSLLDNATANTLAGVLDDLDAAITTSAGGGLTQVTSDSTLNGLGTVASPLSVANNEHTHTANNITDFELASNNAIDARVTQSFVNALNVDADTLDGANSAFYLDYDNFTNTPTDSDTTYDLSIPATGVIRLSDSANSNDDITVVGSGATIVSSNTTHIIISSTDNNTTYSAGNGIDLSGTTFSVAAGSGLTQDASGLSHADTSTQASLTALTGANVVSDIDLDGFGHVTALSTREMTLADFDANLSSFVSTFTLPTVDGANGQVLTTNGSGTLSFTDAAGGGSYSNSDVDAHLNTSTATNNQVLSWTGSDYDWIDQSAGGGGITTGKAIAMAIVFG
jgi:hypothetical protein